MSQKKLKILHNTCYILKNVSIILLWWLYLNVINIPNNTINNIIMVFSIILYFYSFKLINNVKQNRLLIQIPVTSYEIFEYVRITKNVELNFVNYIIVHDLNEDKQWNYFFYKNHLKNMSEFELVYFVTQQNNSIFNEYIANNNEYKTYVRKMKIKNII